MTSTQLPPRRSRLILLVHCPWDSRTPRASIHLMPFQPGSARTAVVGAAESQPADPAPHPWCRGGSWASHPEHSSPQQAASATQSPFPHTPPRQALLTALRTQRLSCLHVHAADGHRALTASSTRPPASTTPAVLLAETSRASKTPSHSERPRLKGPPLLHVQE